MISLLLINWNLKDDLDHCLKSLHEQEYRDFEAILVDNGSSDGSPEMVAEKYPWVKLIALEENTGFCHANNVAAQAAVGDLLYVVNTDTEFPPDMLSQLAKAAEKYLDYHIFSPQMINFFDRRMVDCKGMAYLKSLRGYMLDVGKQVDPHEEPFEIFCGTGGAIMMRREVYETIGLYDESFFINNEDTDFAVRARGAGFRALYLPQVRVFHKRSPTEKKLPDFMLYHIQRNYELAALKNIPWPLWLVHGPRHIAYSTYQLSKWAAKGKAKLVWKAKKDALKIVLKDGRRPVPVDMLWPLLGKKKVNSD